MRPSRSSTNMRPLPSPGLATAVGNCRPSASTWTARTPWPWADACPDDWAQAGASAASRSAAPSFSRIAWTTIGLLIFITRGQPARRGLDRRRVPEHRAGLPRSESGLKPDAVHRGGTELDRYRLMACFPRGVQQRCKLFARWSGNTAPRPQVVDVEHLSA